MENFSFNSRLRPNALKAFALGVVLGLSVVPCDEGQARKRGTQLESLEHILQQSEIPLRAGGRECCPRRWLGEHKAMSDVLRVELFMRAKALQCTDVGGGVDSPCIKAGNTS